ncbi:MAG TPA: DUF4476 domain-containing protein [Bacteroidia bacterium]|nr:DUF4476 domain-containing protein [Bacteroidia bacterium]HNU33494.1 DUF4476 domain-containing protein [Bacteroidia bacterium]
MTKYIAALLIFFYLSHNTSAQVCNQPIPAGEFQSHVNTVISMRTEEAKLEYAKSFIAGRCFTSKQVKQIVLAFKFDEHRYSYATSVYEATADKNNFYDVLDAFKTNSLIFRLYNFMQNYPAHNTPPQHSVWYPENLSFPLCDNYTGQKGCNLPIADVDLPMMIKPLLNAETDDQRKNISERLCRTHCFSASQLIKMSFVFELEKMRLLFLKDAIFKCYDIENYKYIAQVFTHQPYREEWVTFCETSVLKKPEVLPPPPPPCEITPAQMDEYIVSLKKESGASLMLQVAKQIVMSRKCFKAVQIKRIVETMNFESGKLELAKYAYDFCIDKENYLKIKDAFNFSSSKSDLINYINSKK